MRSNAWGFKTQGQNIFSWGLTKISPGSCSIGVACPAFESRANSLSGVRLWCANCASLICIYIWHEVGQSDKGVPRLQHDRCCFCMGSPSLPHHPAPTIAPPPVQKDDAANACPHLSCTIKLCSRITGGWPQRHGGVAALRVNQSFLQRI